MTERLYYNDPGLVEFDATIVSTTQDGDKCLTVLDRSAFYPTSGGQSADRGQLGSERVTDVIENDAGDVVHVTAAAPGMAGSVIRGLIDEERRWKHRQMHTAQHIVSQVAIRQFGLETVSVHLGDEYGAVEFETADLKREDLNRLETEANRIVRSRALVEILNIAAEEAGSLPLRKVPTRSGVIRVIKIGDLDWSACGGTHCNSTAEVGLVKVIGVEKMRGHALLKFLSGAQALSDYGARYEITDKLSKSYSCAVGDLPAKFEKLVDENKELRKELASLSQELIPIRAVRLVSAVDVAHKTPFVVESIAPNEVESAPQIAALVSAQIGGVAILVGGDKLYIATPGGSALHAGNIAKALSAKLGLRGGGSATAAQVGGAGGADKTVIVTAVVGIINGA